MPLSPADQALVADMKQRELHVKSRQRAADAIRFEVRRYRVVLTTLAALAGGVVSALIFFAVDSTLPRRPDSWRPLAVDVALGAIIGMQLARSLLGTAWGRRRLARYETSRRARFTSELHAGRRWQSFYYQDEDISPYVPQILYFIEGERRFDSVEAALAFAKENRQDSTIFVERSRESFTKVAAATNVMVMSTVDESGTPASRVMRFVRSDRPGVWYVTTAPEGTKAHALDRGRIAVLAGTMESGETISSNRVRVRRVPAGLAEVADLYRAQVPGYVDRLTDEERERELVYELTLLSAKVDTWLEREIVEFTH
ncbi:pyridoxamine 5'-phosphate oxidase family protein [Nocardioides conyzicola]|uniref:Pyridoxamine 5'-phosphate oxidase N-terminal domain-containing protein n=1 Tax=Nocardioides conyzicola TaxID=1651781 RepID=A0ABP8Y0V9_9ACTN